VYNWHNILAIFGMIRETYRDKFIDWAAVNKWFRCFKGCQQALEGKVSSSSYCEGELEEMCGSGKKTHWWCAVKPALLPDKLILVEVHKIVWTNILQKCEYKLSHSQG
jgi:hypothetical protein